MPFSSKKQFFYLLYNQPEVWMEWVELYGVPKKFKIGSTAHWKRNITKMSPRRHQRKIRKKMKSFAEEFGAESFEAEDDWEVVSYGISTEKQAIKVKNNWIKGKIKGFEYKIKETPDKKGWTVLARIKRAEEFGAEAYRCRWNNKEYQRIGRKPHHTRTLTGEPITYNHRVCMGCGAGCWTNNKIGQSAEEFGAEERGWHKRTHPKNSKRFYYSKGNRPHYSAQRIKHGAYLDGPGTNLESANFDGKGFDNTKGRMIDLPKDIHEDFMENSHAPVLYSISDESHYGEFGAEGAIHEDTLTNKEIKTNVVYPLLLGILGGTIATVVGNLWSLEIAKKRGHI